VFSIRGPILGENKLLRSRTCKPGAGYIVKESKGWYYLQGGYLVNYIKKRLSLRKPLFYLFSKG